MSLQPVYLVDASIYIFRAWFSISDEFSNSAGEPTNAVYGFTGFLCSLLEQTNAEHIGVAFDESLSKSYRNEIYPAVQGQPRPGAGRAETPVQVGQGCGRIDGAELFCRPSL